MDIPDEPHPTSAWAKALERRQIKLGIQPGPSEVGWKLLSPESYTALMLRPPGDENELNAARLKAFALAQSIEELSADPDADAALAALMREHEAARHDVDVALDAWLDGGQGMRPSIAWECLKRASETGRLVGSFTEAELWAIFNRVGEAIYDEVYCDA